MTQGQIGHEICLFKFAFSAVCFCAPLWLIDVNLHHGTHFVKNGHLFSEKPRPLLFSLACNDLFQLLSKLEL